MINREYYKEQILNVVCDGLSFGVRRSPIEVIPCSSMSCAECEFLEGNCELGRKKWCNEEHDKTPKLTKNEKKFLDILDPDWEYITKNSSGEICLLIGNPNTYYWSGGTCNNITNFLKDYFCDVNFRFIKFKKPWLISDLKKLEVIE